MTKHSIEIRITFGIDFGPVTCHWVESQVNDGMYPYWIWCSKVSGDRKREGWEIYQKIMDADYFGFWMRGSEEEWSKLGRVVIKQGKGYNKKMEVSHCLVLSIYFNSNSIVNRNNTSVVGQVMGRNFNFILNHNFVWVSMGTSISM